MSSRRRVAVLLGILLAGLVSCRNDIDRRPADDDSPECLDEDGTEQSGKLIGDVDGDGSDEEVTVVVDPQAGPDCRALLVVRGRTTRWARLEVLDDSVLGLGLPAPGLLAEIDGAPGAEIVVNVHSGASTQFAALYTVRGRRLVRMSIDSALDDLVAFGGSVTHLEGANCTSDGSLVLAAATPRGRRYAVTRTFLTAQDTSLVVESKEKRVVASRDLNSVPEFAGPPFGSCV